MASPDSPPKRNYARDLVYFIFITLLVVLGTVKEAANEKAWIKFHHQTDSVNWIKDSIIFHMTPKAEAWDKEQAKIKAWKDKIDSLTNKNNGHRN